MLMFFFFQLALTGEVAQDTRSKGGSKGRNEMKFGNEWVDVYMHVCIKPIARKKRLREG
jgi:hypothetical protein